MNNKKIVISFFVEGYEKQNYEAVMRLLADDYIENSPAQARSNADAVEFL